MTQYIHGQNFKIKVTHFLRLFLLIWSFLRHIYHLIMKQRLEISMAGALQIQCLRCILLILILIFSATSVIHIILGIIVQGLRFVIT